MLLTAARAFEEITEVAGIWQHLLDTLATQGLEHVIYISVDADRQSPFVLTNVPQVYATTDPTNDPFLAHICTSYDIVPTGPDFLSDYDHLPTEAKAFITAASAVHWWTGMGIPMRLQGSSRYGGFNLGSSKRRAAFERDLLPRAEEFRFFCLLAHRRIEELGRTGAPLSREGFRDLLVAPESAELARLSPREKEVIYLVAQGMSRKECARMCGISPHTVAEYTKSAYRKLGVSNRFDAAQRVLNTRAF